VLAVTLGTVAAFVPTSRPGTPAPVAHRLAPQLRSSTLADGWAPPSTWTPPEPPAKTEDRELTPAVASFSVPLRPRERAAVEGVPADAAPSGTGIFEAVNEVSLRLNAAAASAKKTTTAVTADLGARVRAMCVSLGLAVMKLRVQIATLCAASLEQAGKGTSAATAAVGVQLMRLRIAIAKVCADLTKAVEVALAPKAPKVVEQPKAVPRAQTPAIKAPVLKLPALISPTLKVSPSTYATEMAALFEEPHFKDVTFEVDGESMTAHKAILATRSEHFKTFFASSNVHVSAPVSIRDTTPAAFKALLRYMYTDELVFADADVLHVMRKAKEMKLDRVYNFTIEHCHRTIREENAVLWFLQADEFEIEEMREVAFRYLTRNFRRIRESSSTSLEMLRAKPDLMMSVMMEAI